VLSSARKIVIKTGQPQRDADFNRSDLKFAEADFSMTLVTSN